MVTILRADGVGLTKVVGERDLTLITTEDEVEQVALGVGGGCVSVDNVAEDNVDVHWFLLPDKMGGGSFLRTA